MSLQFSEIFCHKAVQLGKFLTGRETHLIQFDLGLDQRFLINKDNLQKKNK